MSKNSQPMKKILLVLIITFLAMPSLCAVTVIAPESPFGFEPLNMFEFPDKDFPITRFGARNGDAKANTAAFTKAMSACEKAGGGRIVVPPGEWLCGPIHFRSTCCLFLSEGSVVVFEDDPSLYLPAVQVSWEGAECMNLSPLIYAFECHDIAISGPGRLAPKMDFWRTWFDRPESHINATRQLYAMMSTGVPARHRHMEEDGCRMRPHLIHFNRCTNIQLDGFQIRESPFWTIHLWMCRDVWAHDLDVKAHGHNNDGIDIEMTQHVLVENCSFDQGDDCVVLKAGRNQDGWRLDMPTQDIVVRHCNVIFAHCILGIGSEMSGGVRRVYMHDCHTTDAVYRMLYIKTNHRRGGFVEDITVENISARKAQFVFAIDTDVLYQWRDIVPTFETAVTHISGITMKGATCDQADELFFVRGDQRDPVTDIHLENVKVGTLHKRWSHSEYAENVTFIGVSCDRHDYR